MPFDPQSQVTDLILGIAALATLFTFVKSWRRYWDDEFTNDDRRLGTQVAIFVIPPVVVLFHELGHFLTAKALGVRVVGFHYGLFEGSVTVAGPRTVNQDWVIALAGNAVGIGIGLAMVGVGVAGEKVRRPLRYLLIMGGLLELLFSLVAYPVLSLSAHFGDWIAIYSRRTEGLSVFTGIIHVGLLVGLALWWRRSGRAVLFAVGSGNEAKVAELRKAVDDAPGEPQGWLDLADFYARRGELALARSTVEEGLAACGDVPRLLLGLTRLSMFQGRWNDAVTAARRGLEKEHALDEDVRQPLWANLALALTQMERPEHALPAYERLLPPLADDVRVRYGRGLVRLESGDGDRGRADLRSVVDQLPEGNLLRSWAEARLEGHALKEWGGDQRVPTPYRRAGGPPPAAPLAGL